MKLSIWDVNDKDWPTDGSDRDKLKFLVRYAILAPSGHNTQPWLFKLSGNTLELYADRTRCLPIVDPADRELVISCGCALFFLKIAARKFGYRANINAFPDLSAQDLLAKIDIASAEPASSEELNIFNAILMRHTNRHTFEERSVSQEILNQLVVAANEENSWLHIISEDTERLAVADLIAQGDRTQASDKHFRRELSSWFHPNRSRNSEGMPGYAFGISDFASNLVPLILRTFDWGNGQAAKDQQLALGSPVLAVLGCESDTPQSWLKTGEALANILLTSASQDISASFLNQPIELENLRNQLKELLNTDGYPQILLRMGYGPEVTPTPRRGVDEVLINNENG